jgi:hypothetical protein
MAWKAHFSNIPLCPATGQRLNATPDCGRRVTPDITLSASWTNNSIDSMRPLTPLGRYAGVPPVTTAYKTAAGFFEDEELPYKTLRKDTEDLAPCFPKTGRHSAELARLKWLGLGHILGHQERGLAVLIPPQHNLGV